LDDHALIDDIQLELDSVSMQEIMLTTVSNPQLKRDVHEIIISHFKKRSESGEKFDFTKRDLGLAIILEGLIVMSSGRKTDEKIARCN